MPSESTDPVNAAFFGLAFTAALNPKLLGADLLIIENLRPRAMSICFLAGGLGMSIMIGIVDMLFVQADAVKTQGSVSASVDLALGLCLLVFGALVATDRVGRRARPSRRPRARVTCRVPNSCPICRVTAVING
jgi:hypothetical protein